MRLLFVLLFIVGCADGPIKKECANEPIKKELTYLEKIELMQLAYIDANIEKNKKLKKEDKEGMKMFARCVRNLIPNYHTVSNLMKWQKDGIYLLAEASCDKIIRNKETK